MAISTGDVIRVFPRLLWNGLSDIANVWHMRVNDEGNGVFADIVNDILVAIDVLYSSINAAVPNTTDYADVNLFNTSQNEPYGSYPWPILETGGSATESYAPAVSAFMWFPTGQSQVFGRKWLGPFNEGSIAAGVLNPTLAGLCADLGDLVLTLEDTPGVASGATLEFVVPHGQEGGSEIDPPVYLPAIQYNIAGDVGYQRRRRPGVGS